MLIQFGLFFWGGTMRLGNYLRVFSALSVLLLWHSPSSAADYAWYIGYGMTGNPYPSATAACRAQEKVDGSRTYTFNRVEIKQQSGICYMNQTRNGVITVVTQDQYGNRFDVVRFGDGCPVGTEYNPETGECAAPNNPCADKAGIEGGGFPRPVLRLTTL